MPNAFVTLTINRAEALVALNPGGTSNPFFTATIGAQSVTTPVVEKTLNPVYNVTFTFHDCPLPTMVTLRAFNKIPYVDVEDPLGTATVTLFDVQPETKTTVVQLSHGGVAALAQRAPNGCGAVTIAYSVAPMPQGGATPSAAEIAAPGLSDRSSYAAAQVLTPPMATPMTLPAAPNIDGNGPASLPVASGPREDRCSTPGHTVSDGTGKLLSSNPSITNPPAVAARLSPVEGMASSVMEASSASATRFSVSQLQSSSQLTPPSIAPAPLPATATVLVPQAAPAPPLLSSLNMSLRAPSVSEDDDHAALGATLPSPVPEVAATPSHQLTPLASGSYYANNTVHSAAAAPPVSNVSTQLPSSFAVLPVAMSAPVAIRFASLQESTSPAPSFDAQQQAASASSLYTSAARGPTTTPQTKLLVVPPNINGAPTPTFFHASKPSSCEGSRLPSAAQISLSRESPEASFPAYAPPLVSAGALPVATVPYSPPLTASTTASLCSTPATLSSHRHHSGTVMSGNPFPPDSAATNLLPPSTHAGTLHRSVHPASATAGLQRCAGAGAAFPHSQNRCSAYASTSAAGRPTSPMRSAHKAETKRCTGADTITSASQLYSDTQYLFDIAANGSDLGTFEKLRQVDPDLTNGFLQALDYSGRSLLHIAAWSGQLRVMQILLSPEPTQPMIDLRAVVTAKSRNTVLHAAASNGQAEVAQWLRYSHPTAGPLLLSMLNARGMTAAECAMEAGFPQVARLLMPN